MTSSSSPTGSGLSPVEQVSAEQQDAEGKREENPESCVSDAVGDPVGDFRSAQPGEKHCGRNDHYDTCHQRCPDAFRCHDVHSACGAVSRTDTSITRADYDTLGWPSVPECTLSDTLAR